MLDKWIKPILAIYLIYMMCCFKTTTNLSLTFQNLISKLGVNLTNSEIFQNFGNQLLHHSVTNDHSNKICPLGKLVAVILALALLFSGDNISNSHLFYVFAVLFLVGLVMNLNFAIYLLPVLLILTYVNWYYIAT